MPPLPRPCDIDKGGCGKRFQPTTKISKLCEDCKRKRHLEGQKRGKLTRMRNKHMKLKNIENSTYKPPKLKPSNKKPNPIFCSVCGASCPDKLKVEARRGIYYPSCTSCFGLDLEEFKRGIKRIHL